MKMSIQISPTLSIPVDSNFRKTLREIPVDARWTLTGNFIKVASKADLKNLSSLEKSAFAILYAAMWRAIDYPFHVVNIRAFVQPTNAPKIDRLNENSDVFLVHNTATPYIQGYAQTERKDEPVSITIDQITQGIESVAVNEYGPYNPPPFVRPESTMTVLPYTTVPVATSKPEKETPASKYAEEFQANLMKNRNPPLPNRFSYPEPVIPPQPPKFGTDPNHPYPDYAYARKL